MNRVPNHPHAHYLISRDQMGSLVIRCKCTACGAEWQKICSQPERANLHVYRFAVVHGHGVRPVAPR